MPRTAVRRPADTGTRPTRKTDAAPLKKGPGRPKRVVEVEDDYEDEVEPTAAPKRRGRPTAVEPATPVRRGRQPKVVEEVVEEDTGWSEVNEETGYREGTDLHIAAQELIKGGFTRQEIIDNVREIIGDQTRNGTPKMVANIVSQAHKALIDSNRYELDSHYQLVAVPPPAPKPRKRTAR